MATREIISIHTHTHVCAGVCGLPRWGERYALQKPREIGAKKQNGSSAACPVLWYSALLQWMAGFGMLLMQEAASVSRTL